MADYSKYQALCHAMQSGVAVRMQQDPSDTNPKHLRVGINVAMCDNSALVKLLIAKGIITEDEYCDAITKQMEEEVKSYEAYLSTGTSQVLLA
jgi:hypothetical protein